MSLLSMHEGHVSLARAVEDSGIVECGVIATPVPVGELSLYWISL